MSVLHIGFGDYWREFNPYDNIFTYTLLHTGDINVFDTNHLNDDLDLILYSDYGYSHCQYIKPKRVYFTIENQIPNYNDCDYSISSRLDSYDGRNLFLPEYLYNGFKTPISIGLYDIEEQKYYNELSKEEIDALFNRPFGTCLISKESAVYHDKMRELYINSICGYNDISFGGTWRNNQPDGQRIPDKIDFIKNYKFNLALENSSIPGYITEKIVDCFVAHTIPIYWGAEDIYDFIQEGSFIYANRYTYNELIKEIDKINNDKDLYLEMLMHPKFVNKINYIEILKEYLIDIIYKRPPRMIRSGFNLEHQFVYSQLNSKVRHEIYGYPKPKEKKS